jgi:hypothetical protein
MNVKVTAHLTADDLTNAEVALVESLGSPLVIVTVGRVDLLAGRSYDGDGLDPRDVARELIRLGDELLNLADDRDGTHQKERVA